MRLNYQVKSWIIEGVFHIQVVMQLFHSEIRVLVVVGVRQDFILMCLTTTKQFTHEMPNHEYLYDVNLEIQLQDMLLYNIQSKIKQQNYVSLYLSKKQLTA